MRAIFFDFDGVLTVDKYGSDSILRYLAEHTPVPAEILQREYYKINKGLLLGQYTHKDIWDVYCERVGFKIDYGILLDSFRNTPLDDEMLSLVGELKRVCRIGMITDNKVDRIKEILSYRKLSHLFDAVTISAELKCGKTDRKIFEAALEALDVAPAESLFIDNSQKNLVVPAEMGMHTILFDDEKRNVPELKVHLMELLENNGGAL